MREVRRYRGLRAMVSAVFEKTPFYSRLAGPFLDSLAPSATLLKSRGAADHSAFRVLVQRSILVITIRGTQ